MSHDALYGGLQLVIILIHISPQPIQPVHVGLDGLWCEMITAI